MCYEHCDALDTAYMALQFGHECWCSGRGSIDYSRHGNGDCGDTCEGDDVRNKNRKYTRRR